MEIYLIEGLPGSGKTTYAKRLETHFLNQQKKVIRFNEGDLHPIDLAWCALTDEKTFLSLCEQFKDVKDQIIEHTKKTDDVYITAYTKVRISKQYKDFFDVFSAYEIYREKSFKVFKETHLALWKRFSNEKQEDVIYIFECIFLQNHINELILKFNLSFNEIYAYFVDLLNALDPYKPTVLYINQKNIEKRIRFVANERQTNDKTLYKDWIDLVMIYMEQTVFAKKLGYLKFDGFIRYLQDRKSIELKLLEMFDCPCRIVDLEDDFDETFNQMIQSI